MPERQSWITLDQLDPKGNFPMMLTKTSFLILPTFCANSSCSQRSGHLRSEQSTGTTICPSISLHRGAEKQDQSMARGDKKEEGVLLTSSTLWLIFSFLAHENHTGPAVSQPSPCMITEHFSPVSLLPKPWSRTKASSCARCLLTFRVPWKRPTINQQNGTVTLKTDSFKR